MTECNRCGDCCEHLTIAFTKVQLRAFLVAAEGRPGTARFEDHRADARFILEHWHRAAGGGTRTVYACDAFDAEARSCTAHADRPPICRGYPWYGNPPPAAEDLRLPPRCSFNADQGVAVSLAVHPR